jgi:hypothetical protein
VCACAPDRWRTARSRALCQTPAVVSAARKDVCCQQRNVRCGNISVLTPAREPVQQQQSALSRLNTQQTSRPSRNRQNTKPSVFEPYTLSLPNKPYAAAPHINNSPFIVIAACGSAVSNYLIRSRRSTETDVPHATSAMLLVPNEATNCGVREDRNASPVPPRPS